ncbi:MAG: hypothetical protein PHD60_11150, partial [Clostridia bacterium]|nr:hypothetical protein [Clostridia bacterium]
IMKNVKVVGDTFRLMAQQELVYRGIDDQCTYQDALDDIFQTSIIIGERGRIEKETFDLLQTGIRTIKDYIFSKNFILEGAVNCAAKAAYLSLLIKYEMSEVERFEKSIDLRNFKIEIPEYKKFKSIIKFDPEAYFYWYKSFEILGQQFADATA